MSASAEATFPTGPRRAVRLSSLDLRTFNEYLLQLSRAGLPIEAGLSAMSRDLGRGALRDVIENLLAELRAGVPLERAISAPGSGFPPVYGQLVAAGVAAGDLPGVLSRFGKQTRTIADLRDGLWRAVAYPLVVLLSLLILMSFLGYKVFPAYFGSVQRLQTQRFDSRTRAQLPAIPMVARAVIGLGRAAPFLILATGVAVIGGMTAYAVARGTGRERGWVDVATRLPVIGRAVRDSYLAAWLDIASIGTAAGVDLPRAFRMAAGAVALPSLTADTQQLVARIEAGQRVSDAPVLRLPRTVPMSIDLSTGPDTLPRVLESLAGEYEQNARAEISQIPRRVLPAMLVLIGGVVAGVLYTLWLPLVELLKSI